jgi:hypothetical protein
VLPLHSSRSAGRQSRLLELQSSKALVSVSMLESFAKISGARHRILHINLLVPQSSYSNASGSTITCSLLFACRQILNDSPQILCHQIVLLFSQFVFLAHLYTSRRGGESLIPIEPLLKKFPGLTHLLRRPNIVPLVVVYSPGLSLRSVVMDRARATNLINPHALVR